MADSRELPIFNFADDATQIEDIKKHLNTRGAKIDVKGTDLLPNLTEIVKNAHLVGASPIEAENVLASIASLFLAVPEDKSFELVDLFCNQLTPAAFKGPGIGSPAAAAIRVLSNLFRGYTRVPKIQERIFTTLLDLCREARVISEMGVNQATITEYFARWQSDNKTQITILRKLHAALIADNKADHAAKVMISLLALYTENDAELAVEDAQECVRTAVVDPKSFSFDHIVRLSAVRQLEKKDPAMHKALQLFATGTYKGYQTFVAAHPSFVSDKLHVDEAILVKKIRLLTLMSIAERDQTIPLPLLADELGIADGEELEEFIIEAIQVNAISGKLNEKERTMQVTAFQHRSFGREEWVTLLQRLKVRDGGTTNQLVALDSLHSSSEVPYMPRWRIYLDESFTSPGVATAHRRRTCFDSLLFSSQTIPLPLLADELGIADGEELEEFIIEAIQVNAISGKLNEKERTMQVTAFQHRSFGREEWVTLQQRLKSLIAHVKQSHENIKNVNDTVTAH